MYPKNEVPTTAEVRERFVDGFPIDTWVVDRDSLAQAFDRWLAEIQENTWNQATEALAFRLPVGFESFVREQMQNNPFKFH